MPMNSLLQYMGQFVSDEPASGNARWCKLLRIENDVLADRISESINRPSRFGRMGIAVDAHAAEVLAKARLEKRARRRIERLPG